MLDKTKDNLAVLFTCREADKLDQRRKDADLTLLRLAEDLQSNSLRKVLCDKLNVPWHEYEVLRRQYRPLMREYNRLKLENNNINNPNFLKELQGKLDKMEELDES